MRELFRRLVAVFLLFVGLTLMFTSAPCLYRVKAVSWQDEFEDARKGYPLSRTDTTNALMYASETLAGATVMKTRKPEWMIVYEGVRKAVSNGSAPSWARARRGIRSYAVDYIYASPDTPPFHTLSDHVSPSGRSAYLQVIGGDGEESHGERWLSVSYQEPDTYLGYAPRFLAWPGRWHGFLVVLAGLCVYLVIPRKKREAGEATYAAHTAGWLPDFIALLGGGSCFALGFLVNDGAPFSGRLVAATLVLWTLSAVFLSIVFIAAHYQARAIRGSGEVLIYQSLLGRRIIPVATIEQVSVVPVESPKWLKCALWFVAIFNWRAVGFALLQERVDPALLISTCDGSPPLKLVATGLTNIGALRDWFHSVNIPVVPEIDDLCDIAMKKSSPSVVLKVRLLAVGLLAVIVVSLWLFAKGSQGVGIPL